MSSVREGHIQATWLRIFVIVLETLAIAWKVVLGMSFLCALFPPVLVVLLALLPWRTARIRFTNALGTVVGWTLMRISGCPIAVSGRENFDGARPAICVGNHTSVVDAFTSVWLAPSGTVGVAKREILRYPVYGQIWFLSGHLIVDRSKTERAKASLRELARFVRQKGLQVLLWPEGTRARDGRLQPFKKGFVHLAIETGLPVVPMVTAGAQNVWRRGSLRLREVPINITFLPPIDTSTWRVETASEHVREVWEAIRDALPIEQRPLPSAS